jgi:hypothetical protein
MQMYVRICVLCVCVSCEIKVYLYLKCEVYAVCVRESLRLLYHQIYETGLYFFFPYEDETTGKLARANATVQGR